MTGNYNLIAFLNLSNIICGHNLLSTFSSDYIDTILWYVY